MKISAELQQWSDCIGIRLGEARDGVLHSAKKIEFAPVPENLYVDPCINLRITDAQLLMDELWRCGLRPSEGTGSAGALAAVQYHLEDMRRIAFKGKP